MNNVEKAFLPKAIKKGGILFYKRDDAIEFVKTCQKEKIRILGIDGFFLTEKTTQPSMEDSDDYSKVEDLEDVYQMSLELLNTRSKTMYFEIVCDGWNSVENLFLHKAVIRGNKLLYKQGDALEFVMECQKAKIKILKIDGFDLTADAAQYSKQDSFDLSEIEDMYEVIRKALKFLKNRDRNKYFEITSS